ncbi:phage tail spike protein [Clostridium perfringens]
MELLQLYDKNKKKIAALTEYENLCIESILESGDKTLSFYYSLFYKFYDEIEEETYIRTKTDEYVVKAKGGDSNDNKTLFTCKLNVEELEGTIFDRFESVEQNLVDALNLAIVGTGWRLNSDNCNNRKKRTIRMTNCSSWTIIQKAKKLYDIEFKFDTLNKIIMLFDKIGDDRGIYFIDSLNLRALQVQGNSYGFYTRIIPTGKDGLTIASVNGGKTYLENKQYSNKTLTYYWKDERYTKPESLKEDALEKLNIMSKPFKSYIASTINLAKMNGKYKDILDYNLGDYIYLISKKNKVKDKHRIVKTKEYPQDHSKDTVELANKALDLSEEKLLVDEMSNTLENITTDNGTVDGSTIDSITTKQIEDFEANVIKVAKLKAILAEIENLHVNKADIQNLNAVIARIGTLEVTKASITELNAIHAIIQQIKAGKADITDLNAAVAKVGILENKTAVLENALAGNLTADNFKTNAITAGSAVIADGAIGSSQISSLSVNKLEAGDITTSKHRIVSADGTIEIVGNQILINRNNVNRVILGEYRKTDSTTDYGLLIRGKDGKTIMLDSDGVHNAGITNGAIDNNKVADNANISGNKLDINSVIREVNTHGTETIKGTKVTVGDRTLDVGLSTQKNTITEHGKELSSQKATIQALDSAIKLKVDSQTFTQSTQTINSNITRAKEQAIIGARSIPDTRNSNESPGWYMQHYAFQTITEFKYANVIGVPNGGLWFGTLETTVPWNNSSGGYPTQVFRSNSSPVYQRHGTDLNTWNSWEQIEDTQGSQAKANNALSNAKSYSDSKKQEAIKAAENLALEKSNLAKKYAEDVATAKANLAKTEAIANADGKISAEEKKRIQQAQENLNTAISKADKAKQDAILEANRVAELKKQEAISSANSHADNKANEALNNAKAFVNAEITTVNSHLNKATAEINVLKEKIELKVSQSDVDKVVENVKFGNRNYLKNSLLNTTNSDYCIARLYFGDEKPQEGEEFTVSIKGELGEGKSSFGVYNSGGTVSLISLDNKNSDGIYKGTFKWRIGTSSNTYLSIYTIYSSVVVNSSIEWVKLEKGNKVSNDWTPAPEDTKQLIVDNIKTVTDKITTVESKFTQENNSIKASVQDLNSTTQTITTNVSNINRDLTSKINSNLDAAKSFATDIAIAKANLAKEQAIASADGKITAEEQKRIQQAQANLNTAIAKATESETKAKSYADVKKQEAINTASTDATNKANNALNSAKAFVNAEITTVNNKVHNVESNIDILKNKIALKVEQSDIDKTKTELINKINVVDNLANNAKDLASAMSLGKMLFSDPTFKNSSNNIKTYNNNENGTVTTSRISKINGCPTDSQYCIEVKTVGSASPNHGGFYFGNMTRANAIFVTKIIAKIPVGLRIGWYSNSTGNNGSSKWLTSVNGTGKWEEYIHLLKCGDTGSFSSTSFFALDGGGTPTSSNPIIWHIAYATVFDITENDESVNVLKTEMSTAKNKVAIIETNLDSITQRISSTESKTHSIETTLGGKASKQEVAEVNNRVATIKANLDSITQRVSNTESKTNSLETNINGKASKQELTVVNNKVTEVTASLNGITQRVGNTESRINALDGKVAGAVTLQQFTEFKQSNDKFKFTVEQRSSVSNILPNSSFHGGDRGWLHGGNEFWSGPYSGYGFKGRITGAIKNRAAYNNPERYLQTHKAYKVKKNTTYTINFHYICEKNVQSMDAFVVLSDTEHGDYAQPICVLTAQGGSQSNATEEKPFTYKFNTGNHEWVWIRFDHNGMKSGVNWDEFCWVYVSEIGIYEGDVGAVKWTPKGGEVYSANYQMDGLGFKGTFEDGTYAQLGRDGFEWYNAGTGHAYHALTYVTSFDVPIGNPGKAYIKLPAEFTKRRSSLKWTVALRGYYYSTDGDFFPFHIHCTGGRDYIENGLVVCEVQGYCKIQNAQNAGDVQFRPLTAMLIAIA